MHNDKIDAANRIWVAAEAAMASARAEEENAVRLAHERGQAAIAAIVALRDAAMQSIETR